MKKKLLLKMFNREISRNEEYWAKLLCEFLKTEEIQNLADKKHVYFHDYLTFIQKNLLNDHTGVYPTKNPSKLFEPPWFSSENRWFIIAFMHDDMNIHNTMMQSYEKEADSHTLIRADYRTHQMNQLQIYNSFLTCALFQKEMQEVFPKELLLKIYSLAFPFLDNQTIIYPLRAKAPDVFAQGICEITFFNSKKKRFSHRSLEASKSIGYAGLTLVLGTLSPTLELLAFGCVCSLWLAIGAPAFFALGVYAARGAFYCGSKTKHKALSALGSTRPDHSSKNTKTFAIELNQKIGVGVWGI